MCYKLTLRDKVEASKLGKIKRYYSELTEGISELYDELTVSGSYISYIKNRIYYVAYL